ncbi:MAG: hypothetical protein GY805_28870 [Chloroflexi bacterium]|nr:hypothetical protein [Chloroflexota bacterium]
MRKRIKMKCWHCKREYSLLKSLDVDEKPRLIVECPFCENEAVVDLAPFRTENLAVLRSGDATKTGTKLDLPDVLPTSPVEK